MLKTPEYIAFLDLLRGENFNTLSYADLDRLFEVFKRHRLLNAVSEDTLLLLDQTIKEKWQTAIRKNTFRSLKLTGELEKIFRELNREDLEVYSVKGPVLSRRLFGDVGKRHYRDLDLVVRQGKFTEVVIVLKGLGYEMAYPNKELSLKQWEYYFKYKKDATLINCDTKVVVELHVDIFRRELIRSTSETFTWDRLAEESFGAVPVKCLDLNTSFLYLIYHGGQHMYFRLFWLRDIDEALVRWELDHEWIMEKAGELGIDRLLGMGLLLSQEIFRTKIPIEYDQYLRRNRSVLLKLQKICISRIFGPERENWLWKIRRYRFVLLLQPGLSYFFLILRNIFYRRHIRRKLGGL